MQLNVNGAAAIEVCERTFGGEYNETLIHQAVVAFMAGGRQGSKQQNTRSEVRGGGKKPWRQKGTGRARSGMTSSPIWRGGGRAFPNSPEENFSQKVNRKMHRAALCSIYSQLVRDDRLVVVEDFVVEAPKTKLVADKLKAMGVESVMIITDDYSENLFLASRNLPHVYVCEAKYADPLSLLFYKKVVVTKGAVAQIEEILS